MVGCSHDTVHQDKVYHQQADCAHSADVSVHPMQLQTGHDVIQLPDTRVAGSGHAVVCFTWLARSHICQKRRLLKKINRPGSRPVYREHLNRWDSQWTGTTALRRFGCKPVSPRRTQELERGLKVACPPPPPTPTVWHWRPFHRASTLAKNAPPPLHFFFQTPSM